MYYTTCPHCGAHLMLRTFVLAADAKDGGDG